MTTRKYPVPGCLITGEELALFAREKIASLTPEEATAILAEVEAEEAEFGDDSFEVVPKTAEDQEAFGVGIYQGTQECSRRFNELSKTASYEDVMAKLAEEIDAFDADTAAMREAAATDPDQELFESMVAKVAEEDPAALAEFAAKRLGELGYEVKAAAEGDEAEEETDGSEGVEDEETEDESEESAS